MADDDEVTRDATGERRLFEPPGHESNSEPTGSAATLRTELGISHSHLDIAPQRTELQPATGHTPSPDRYEFALTGLLALSGTEAIFVPPNNEQELPEVAVQHRSRTPVVDTFPMVDASSRNERRTQHVWQTDDPSRNRVSDQQHSGIAVADYAVFERNSTDHVEYQQMPQIVDNEGTLNLGSNAANFVNPMWPTDLGGVSTDDQKNLTAFRYELAPWVSFITVGHYDQKLNGAA